LPIQKCWGEAGREVKLFLDRSELVQELKKTVMSGDVVLLKGSNASGVWKIIEEL
jgi:UDP-N-acetylmuramyl pentapeptide synthase